MQSVTTCRCINASWEWRTWRAPCGRWTRWSSTSAGRRGLRTRRLRPCTRGTSPLPCRPILNTTFAVSHDIHFYCHTNAYFRISTLHEYTPLVLHYHYNTRKYFFTLTLTHTLHTYVTPMYHVINNTSTIHEYIFLLLHLYTF